VLGAECTPNAATQTVLQSHVPPGLAAVGGLVDAVALHDVAAQFGLAHPDVDDVRVRLAHLHRAHRRAVQLAVGDGAPRLAAVGGLPKSPAGRAEVVLERPRAAPRHGLRAAAAVGTEVLPAEGVVEGAVVLGRERGREQEADGNGGETAEHGTGTAHDCCSFGVNAHVVGEWDVIAAAAPTPVAGGAVLDRGR
jgi:hypothetical protein